MLVYRAFRLSAHSSLSRRLRQLNRRMEDLEPPVKSRVAASDTKAPPPGCLGCLHRTRAIFTSRQPAPASPPRWDRPPFSRLGHSPTVGHEQLKKKGDFSFDGVASDRGSPHAAAAGNRIGAAAPPTCFGSFHRMQPRHVERRSRPPGAALFFIASDDAAGITRHCDCQRSGSRSAQIDVASRSARQPSCAQIASTSPVQNIACPSKPCPLYSVCAAIAGILSAPQNLDWGIV